MKGTRAVLLLLTFEIREVYGFWRMGCSAVQVGRVDPIISPNSVAGHVHMISGASNFNTTSNYNSLQAASCTSCSVQQDKSAYWTPLLYYQMANGSVINVPNDGTVVYYLGRGDDRANIIVFPPGLQMLSGDSRARSYDNATRTYGNSSYPSRPVSDRVSFNCIDYQKPAPETPNIANTNCPNGLRAQIHFQSCWDGVNLYKSDQSHVAYLSQIDNGICPPTHPKLLPHLFYEIYYYPNRLDTSDGGRFVFANGDLTGYGFHGDFLNGWNTSVLTKAIAQCINTVESGSISDCPPLVKSQDNYASTNCPERPPLVAEQVKGVLPKLPGCNTPTTGPDRAPVEACSSQPSLNPVANTDGQTRTVPTANSTTIDLGSGRTARYQGCYSDTTSSRALAGASYTNQSSMANEACASFCQLKGFSLFGTEYAQECYCGNTISTTTTPQSDCAMVCKGNSTQFCGGPNRLSVWAISGNSNVISSTTTSSATSTRTSNSISTGTSMTTTTSRSSALTTVQTTSTGSSTIPTPIVSGASYVACFSDNTGSRTLTESYTTNANMTLEVCAQTAQNLNKKYFGLEYSGECFAGNTLGSSAGQISASQCNMPCKGNSKQVCGGSNALSLFQNNLFVKPTNPTNANVTGQNVQYTYSGCFTEGTSGRSLGGSSSYSTTSSAMTVELCISTCFSKGYNFAGVEYSQECYCNTVGITNGGASAPGGDADCSMICAGNKGQFCGGSNRVSMYKLNSSTASVQKTKSARRFTGVRFRDSQ